MLRKRAGYRAAFAAFDPARVARFDDATVARLATDPAIVRHRGKIASTVSNARAFLAVQAAFGSFDAYVWTFTGGAPLRTPRREPADVPATSAAGDALSRDLRARGFRFVGPTIVYAFMQATGLVDDHLTCCFRSAPVR